MDGFRVSNQPINEMINKAGTFKTLIQDVDFEIFESHIHAGRSVICQPYECVDALSIAFVISGKLYHTNTGRYILPGERFTFKNLIETHHLSVIEDTVLFMIRRKGLVDEQMVMIESVSRLLQQIQMKDLYTEDHCNRTGNLAVEIAVHMQLPEDVIENVLYTGKFHDVGKIDISAHILNKQGRLTVDEFDNIKKHPQAGYNIVMREMANEHYAKIVLEHHEKLDGSGYPKGLKGDDICIEAKVILVADSFDAMTSDRPYHEAKTTEEAIAELRSYAGIWYDPDIVEALAETIEKRKQFEK